MAQASKRFDLDLTHLRAAVEDVEKVCRGFTDEELQPFKNRFEAIPVESTFELRDEDGRTVAYPGAAFLEWAEDLKAWTRENPR